MRFILSFIKRQRLRFFLILLCSLAWPVEAVVWPFLLRLVVNIFTEFDTMRAEAWSALQQPIFLGLGLIALVEFSFRTKGHLLAKALPRLEAEMRMAMFDHVQHHSPKYFNEHLAGSLSTKINDVTTQIPLLLQQIFGLYLTALLLCFFSLTIFFWIHWLFALILGVWLVLHFALCFFFAQKCDTLENTHSKLRSALTGKIVDSLTNNFAVNIFYRFPEELETLAKFQQKETAASYQSKIYVERLLIALSSVFFPGLLSIISFILYFWLQGTLSTGEVVQLFNTTWATLGIVWLAGPAIPQLFQILGTIRQGLAIMDDPQDILDLPNAQPLQVTSGSITFENVSFHYGTRELFRNKNISIRGGERVGLVGYSGAGKSTFVNLILRFYRPEEGRILIDGQDIAHVTLRSLREKIALIPQDPILFHRSLKENIGFGKRHATDREIEEAAKQAHCDEFIQKIPQGYEAMVGERGTKLSGGERQRIVIARALLPEAPILILDEATSALDSVTEKYIQATLEACMHQRTLLVVAHRLSTLAQLDRILVFDQGKIIEDGSHAQLLQKGGHYAHMWKLQAGGFMPSDV